MLKSILSLFNDSQNSQPDPHRLEIAAAALFSEVVRADNNADAREISTLRTLINENFDLSEDELQKVVAIAEERSEDAVDLVQFTKAINDEMGADDKEKIMLGLWRVAYADNQLDPNEEHIIRRIADLLYVPHSRFIKSKLTAKPQQ